MISMISMTSGHPEFSCVLTPAMVKEAKYKKTVQNWEMGQNFNMISELVKFVAFKDM